MIKDMTKPKVIRGGTMKKTFRLILVLVVIALVGTLATIQKQRKMEADRMMRANALGHEIESVLKYKSQYMGDASNISELNRNLPLFDIERTNEIDSKNLKYTIKYEDRVFNIGEYRVKSNLIYNATANFALIDNLEAIEFYFEDVSYTLSRQNIVDWYGDDISSLLKKEVWAERVQSKLSDPKYIDEFWESLK